MRDLDELFAVIHLVRRGSPTPPPRSAQWLRRPATTIPCELRQTPFRGHPVFIAQHATATCCRECLAKWHRIPRNTAFRPHELENADRVIRHGLETGGD